MKEAREQDWMQAVADLALVAKEAAEGQGDREALRMLARRTLEKHRDTLSVMAQLAAEVDAAEMPGAHPPGYWMSEQSGRLRPVIEKYLRGDVLTPEECATMRAYCRQWIMADGFRGPDVEELRRGVAPLTDDAAIRAWMEKAIAANVDPL